MHVFDSPELFPILNLNPNVKIQMFIGTTIWNMSYHYTQIQQEHTHTQKRKKEKKN